jgi:hypothetical protein
MPGIGLQPGTYAIGATIRERTGARTVDWWYGRTALEVEPGRAVRGYFYTPHDWRLVVEAMSPTSDERADMCVSGVVQGSSGRRAGA